MATTPLRDELPDDDRRTPLEIVEGLYVARITEFFYSSGLFERLVTGATVDDLCAEFGFDRDAIAALLKFICERTTLLRQDRAATPPAKSRSRAAFPAAPPVTYTFNPQNCAYHTLGYHFEKFMGVYGPVLTHLSDCAVDPGRGPEFADHAAMGRALQQLDVPPNPIVRQIVRELGVTSLLDLGCGTGQSLAALAEADHRMEAAGIEEDPRTCALARKRMEERGLADRVKIVCGDVKKVAELSRGNALPDVECVYARGLLNALFWPTDEKAVACLTQLRTLYPGKLLLVEDYYGRLNSTDDAPQGDLQAVLQDIAQVLTGQGIPPSTRSAWAMTYTRAGCTLFHAFEGRSDGLPWFVHLVRLAAGGLGDEPNPSI